jgi:hypothetical protein
MRSLYDEFFDAFLIRCVPCKMSPLYNASLVRSPLVRSTRSLYDVSLERWVPCTMRPSYTRRPFYEDDLSLGWWFPRMIRLEENASPQGPMIYFFPLLFTASLIFKDISSAFCLSFLLCCTSHLSQVRNCLSFKFWGDGYHVPKNGDDLSQNSQRRNILQTF